MAGLQVATVIDIDNYNKLNEVCEKKKTNKSRLVRKIILDYLKREAKM